LSTFFDKNSELDLKVVSSTQDIVNEVKNAPKSKSFESLKIVLPKLKALWLGYSTRKLYYHLVRQTRPNHQYFGKAEIFETLNGMFTGTRRYATYSFQSGAVYVGEWLGGFRHGYGAMIWPDSAKYEGNWSFGRPAGYGKFVHIDMQVYHGAWINFWIFPKDLFSSAGNFEKLKDSASDGFLWLYAKHEMFKIEPPEQRRSSLPRKNSSSLLLDRVKSVKIQSESIFKRFSDLKSSLHQSFTIDNSKSFKETTSEDGSSYTGNFKNGKKEGYGKFTWPNGDTYEGLWVFDKQHGTGKQTWTSGNFYLGQFVSDFKEGLGEYHWKDGSFYIGEWKRSKMHGIGKHKWNDGKEYVGEWNNGAREGVGVMIDRNGSRYEGNFVADRHHGLGVLFESGGRILKGNWENGKFKEPVFT
jgi:hypothetical protein